MNTMAWTYIAYTAVTVGITVWVARTLRKHGGIYLTDGHETRTALTDALSHLLIVGFYLVNFGVICFMLKSDSRAADVQTSIELLSTKIGSILVVVGGMHFVLLAIFASIRRNADTRPWEENGREHAASHAAGNLAAKRQTW